MDKITTISLKQETYEHLKKLGKMGQSFDDLILELIMKFKEDEYE